MKKIALSVEQMHKLESLGLDTSNASMFYEHTKSGNMFLSPNSVPKINKINEYTNAYTLQDILDILPKEILKFEHMYLTIKALDNNAWLVAYMYYDGLYWIYETGKSLLECLYNLLIKCIGREYIKAEEKK